jgi:predicted amidohydrolase YtcJ
MATRLTTILVAVIVGATFIAGLIVGAQRDDASGPVDLIIVNGKVYPGGGAALQEAVAVRGNQILRVGSNREVKRLRRAQTVVLDAHGATVLPGLNDAQVHLMSGALTLEHLNLSAASTIDDVETELRHYAEDNAELPWLVGHDADPDLLGASTHPRKTLDGAVPDRPVLITSEHAKIAWANSRALELAGLTGKTRNRAAGIVRDRRTGEPTGVLRDGAVDLAVRAVPQPTRAEKLAALRAAIDEAQRLGITSVQSVSSSEEELQLLDEIRKDGDLELRVSESIVVTPAITEARINELNQLREDFPDDPALKLGGVLLTCPCEPQQIDRAVTLLDKHELARDGEDGERLGCARHGRRVRARHQRQRHADPHPSHSPRRQPAERGPGPHSLRQQLARRAPRPARGRPRNRVGPGELRSAIDAYTTHAAYASYDELRKGTLARGMLADIVILSNDIFEARPNALGESAVTVTIFDGKIVYQRPPAASSND